MKPPPETQRRQPKRKAFRLGSKNSDQPATPSVRETSPGGLTFDDVEAASQQATTSEEPEHNSPGEHRQRRNTPTSGWPQISREHRDDSPATTSNQSTPNGETRAVMSDNLTDVLSKLASIDGFIATAIGDSSSGMTLASKGGDQDFDIEVAIAANTEVVKAKNRALRALKLDGGIEDILITLSSQYHLIRPLTERPEIFLYVAVDRERANLAMARLVLGDAEKMFEL